MWLCRTSLWLKSMIKGQYLFCFLWSSINNSTQLFLCCWLFYDMFLPAPCWRYFILGWWTVCGAPFYSISNPQLDKLICVIGLFLLQTFIKIFKGPKDYTALNYASKFQHSCPCQTFHPPSVTSWSSMNNSEHLFACDITTYFFTQHVTFLSLG